MQKQDLETNENIVLKQLLTVVVEVLKDYTETVDINPKLTIEDCYNKMKSNARKKAVNNSYCFGPEETKEFIVKYLDLDKSNQKTIKEEVKSNFVNLEDFI